MSRGVSDLAKNIIQEYEAKEGDEACYEASMVRFTAQLPYDELSMLDAIAANYGDTRANLVTEILQNITMELFFSLNPHAKKACSLAAAELEAKHQEKNGIIRDGVSKWVYMTDHEANKDA